MRNCHLGDLVNPLKRRLVEFFWPIEEGSVTATFPHVELYVLEMMVHEFLQFIAENVLVHGSLKDEERKFVLDGEKGTFVLSARESEETDLRVLSRDASHPSVLGQLRHLVGICDARLDESFSSLTPLAKVVCEKARDELDNPGVCDFAVHAPPRESSRNNDAGDSVRAMVTQNISGDDGYLVLKNSAKSGRGSQMTGVGCALPPMLLWKDRVSGMVKDAWIVC